MQANQKKFYSMLGLSIFCSILFSFIAFPAILYSSKANTQYALGNVDEALKLNKKAVIWCWVSVIASVAIIGYQLSAGSFSFDLEKTFNPKTAVEKRVT